MPARGTYWVIAMYLRFIVVAPQAWPHGLFRSDFRPHYDDELPEWLRAPIDELYAWFNENLAIPRRFTVVSRRRRIYAGLCWFQSDAHEHIARARELAQLIAEAGRPTAMLKTRRPGQILYRDAYQIVAKPETRR
ncbi:MAG: hypothetical protein GC190_04755 [Alphaproteobacteria bacterium]|nr:hypothetical protein [Alphaproteobacteria bacterium]